MCYNEIASCVVMGGRHSFLTTPYGIGSLDCRGKERCITMRSQAVLSRVGDTLFKQLLMGLGAWTAEGSKRLNTLNGIGIMDCRGKETCITMRSQAVLSRVGDTHF